MEKTIGRRDGGIRGNVNSGEEKERRKCKERKVWERGVDSGMGRRRCMKGMGSERGVYGECMDGKGGMREIVWERRIRCEERNVEGKRGA